MSYLLTEKIHKKKLLMLGSSMGSIDIINYAKSRGVYTIATDYLSTSDSPAKQVADEGWDISTANLELLYAKAKQENIDAIFAGISDFNLGKALTLCELLDLPFYCTRQQWNFTKNKSLFKRLCQEHGVPIVPDYSQTGSKNDMSYSKINFPLIVKPVDSGGGKGIRICQNSKELGDAIHYALSYSRSKKYIIEPYFKSHELTIFYVVQNGRFFLTGIGDRFTKHKQGNIIPLPVAYIFPSKHTDYYGNNIDKKVITMFESLDIKNGVIFIQAFVNYGNIYFYEMGFRLTGTQEYFILDRECGVNTMKMMVNYALAGNFYTNNIDKKINPSYKKHYCILNFLVKPGKIHHIYGLEKLYNLPEVIKVIIERGVNHIIREEDVGTLKQIALRVFAEAASENDLAAVITRINKLVKITDETGGNIMLDPLHAHEINTC